MTLERWLLLAFGVLSVVGTYGVANAAGAGLPPWLVLVFGLVSVGATAGAGLVRGWFDAAPAPPHG